ncbi:EAL domain-containing protein [Actinotalea sp.]|uniref:putative bifunctional diguanylate cyclase/phosphodiesterase n=1 Tax=Actinotalea sp. TaxID=1872145 RepID=UPI002C6EB64C|nr:EAL domain-containing protein [Actinotalea sp.]HQY34379.1 EAL domain-containing protein [Actinotalea sp.]HRA50298.1 EAL domain-containing protein [Actinotalea sp.]
MSRCWWSTSLSLLGDESPEVVIEIVTNFAETAEAIDRDTSVLYAWLAGGLLVLYLALFRLVATASRRLRQQSEANRDLALHDTLTGLPNRSLLRDRALQAIAAGRRHGHDVALLLLDLDRFKEINDTLGHHHGDLLLTMIGPRLAGVLRAQDTIARLGGDEFVVLLPEVGGRGAAVAVAQKILAALDEPFSVDGVDLDVDSSLGIAVSPEHGEDFETLLRHADVAMYAAKEHQTGTAVYDPEQDANSPARLALLGELRRGIEAGQLVLHYQPKADIETGQITGVEALVRWQHPTRGLLGPDEFVPLAERTGLIRPLTLVVLDRALAQAARWAAADRPLAVAVNISARSLLDLDLHDDVAAALTRHGVPGERLALEITESSVMVDPDRALLVLGSLAALGVSLSLDDFGTGYSSLAYLQRLPVHELKIDRSFVMNLAADTNQVIVSASIDLAHNLGLRVIAEGVEDQSTWDRLAELGCQSAQGYHLSRPVPADQLGAWLDARVGPPQIASAAR